MSVGPQLQHARVERKLSLADVTRQTKIQPWVLEALEADRLQELMSPIYVKGFLATYAKFLNLDPEMLVAQLPWPKPEPEQAALPPATRAIPAVHFPQLPLPLLKRLGAAVMVSAAVAGLMVLNPLRRLKAHVALPNPTHRKLASVTKISEPVTPSALPTLTLMATQPLELVVTAHSTMWIQVRADGKLISQQRLPRGANERWTAQKRFELVVSKPSQVDLSLNGQPLNPFAIALGGRLLITHRGVTQLPPEEP